MEPLEVAKSALKTIWTHKALWVFGFFVAAAGGTGAARGGGAKPHLPGVLASHHLPPWVFGLIAVGLVLGVAGLVFHVICDAALMDGVRRSRASEPVTVRLGLRA